MSYLSNGAPSRNIELDDHKIEKLIHLLGSDNRVEVPVGAQATIYEDDIDAAVFASLFRILEGKVPVENRLQVFRLGVLTAVRNLDRLIQQYQADLRQFADDTGLIRTFGSTMVEEVIRTEFGGGQ